MAVGCSSGGAEIRATGSLDDATTVLKQALDAWKSGTTAESLSTAEPKVVVADEDWTTGKKLTQFSIGEKGTENGGHWRIPVKLTIGKEKSLNVHYAVTPGNPASVIRSDFNE
jgi:hypothetical protein